MYANWDEASAFFRRHATSSLGVAWPNKIQGAVNDLATSTATEASFVLLQLKGKAVGVACATEETQRLARSARNFAKCGNFASALEHAHVAQFSRGLRDGSHDRAIPFVIAGEGQLRLKDLPMFNAVGKLEHELGNITPVQLHVLAVVRT